MKKSALIARIELPEGFDSAIEAGSVTIKNSKGQLKREIPVKEIKVSRENNAIVLESISKKRKARAVLNSFERHLQNMVQGLSNGYKYKLAVVYSHFPINVSVKGTVIEINNFLGEKLARKAMVMPGASVEIKGKEVFVQGLDKEAVGQTAINIEKAAKVTGRDKRIFQDGIFLVEKTKVENNG